MNILSEYESDQGVSFDRSYFCVVAHKGLVNEVD